MRSVRGLYGQAIGLRVTAPNLYPSAAERFQEIVRGA